MTINTVKVNTSKEAFDVLENLFHGWYRFRGQQDANWRLQSTLTRHHLKGWQPGHRTSQSIKEMNRHFVVNLATVGITVPFEKDNLRARLEYARHYGIPSPLIDFTFSPYIALFFAFSDLRLHEAKKDECAAVYCIQIFELAGIWANMTSGRDDDGRINSTAFADIHNGFKYDPGKNWNYDYPINTLEYLELPATWNKRMLRQLGVFLIRYP